MLDASASFVRCNAQPEPLVTATIATRRSTTAARRTPPSEMIDGLRYAAALPELRK